MSEKGRRQSEGSIRLDRVKKLLDYVASFSRSKSYEKERGMLPSRTWRRLDRDMSLTLPAREKHVLDSEKSLKEPILGENHRTGKRLSAGSSLEALGGGERRPGGGGGKERRMIGKKKSMLVILQTLTMEWRPAVCRLSPRE